MHEDTPMPTHVARYGLTSRVRLQTCVSTLHGVVVGGMLDVPPVAGMLDVPPVVGMLDAPPVVGMLDAPPAVGILLPLEPPRLVCCSPRGTRCPSSQAAVSS